MITGGTLDEMGYYDASYELEQRNFDPYTTYSSWVEGKIMTEGGDRVFENTLGLVGEAGEVAEKIKKLIRDDTRFNDKDILQELGDVLFYTVALANYYNGNLKMLINMNVEKLDGRQARGTLKGSGDDR
ncbi:MazG-like pyrophosphatase [Lentibacter phage vB_LenP_ICBM2]|uniref:MazG-related NTP pyrophosphohydrolase n=1 Tax=Lentibacter phage vB_LenP_ICBM2 TaxID=2847823 RepID=A0A3G2YRA6_9CAUD|nr:MazG-like pyrophosphatase [Lentibacter phage vB_LenP_ICBM2]AYP28085.1 MazG-related NTP pyrophosphohydrolase [Lentibacter phage vB_LenP_ICBM2]